LIREEVGKIDPGWNIVDIQEQIFDTKRVTKCIVKPTSCRIRIGSPVINENLKNSAPPQYGLSLSYPNLDMKQPKMVVRHHSATVGDHFLRYGSGRSHLECESHQDRKIVMSRGGGLL
jgi:hypothetical protein